MSTPVTSPTEPAVDARPGPVRWTVVTLGCLAIGWGLWQLFVVAPSATRPFVAMVWLAGALLAHDAVLAPITVIAGAGVARVLGPRSRRVIAGVLLAAVSLVFVALPGWLRR